MAEPIRPNQPQSTEPPQPAADASGVLRSKLAVKKPSSTPTAGPQKAARERSARLRRLLRGLALFGFTLLALLLGLAYPALSRGSDRIDRIG